MCFLGSPEDDKFPAAPGHKRKRAPIAPPIGAIPAMMVAADGRVIHVVDTSKEPSMEPIKPIHFNIPPVIDSTRSSDERPQSIAERSSRSDWDAQQSLSALEARLGAQNEAVWSRIRMLNEQVCNLLIRPS